MPEIGGFVQTSGVAFLKLAKKTEITEDMIVQSRTNISYHVLNRRHFPIFFPESSGTLRHVSLGAEADFGGVDRALRLV